ncbi:MAG: 50S ribosomal protein L7/L12 [Chloroflexi bacterium]|nr:50S ribosomal protein L7/L12 [Chloroflexota bacterium]
MEKTELIEAIEKMTVLDLADLVKALEEKFGVKAAVAAGPAMAAPSATAAAAPEDEQTEFTVMLKDFGAKKIEVIKVVRELTALGLKEAKDLVEAAPKSIKELVPKDEANAAAEKLRAVGATVDVV